MGLYADRVLPRVINVACGMSAAEPFRQRVAAGLAGEVVEIGFGSGLNVPHYPAAVTAVSAVEPSDVGWKLAGSRVRGALGYDRVLSDADVAVFAITAWSSLRPAT